MQKKLFKKVANDISIWDCEYFEEKKTQKDFSLNKKRLSEKFKIWEWLWRKWFRSSHQKCSIEKAVLKNFATFTGNHLCWSLFLVKLQAKFLRSPILKIIWKRLLLVIHCVLHYEERIFSLFLFLGPFSFCFRITL